MVNRFAIHHEVFLFDKGGEALVVRAKRVTTAGRQAREAQDKPRRLAGLAACRWRSA
jgi:hypothetical protein